MQRSGFMVAVFALALLLPALAQSPTYIGAAPSDQLTATLLEKETALVTAEMHGDRASVGKLIANDFVFVSYDGHSLSKSEALGELNGGLKEFAIYEPQALTLNDGAVMLSYNAIVRVSVDDDEIHVPRYQRVTTIWVKDGSDWKQKFHQSAALQVGS
jgi:hypothetical protein